MSIQLQPDPLGSDVALAVVQLQPSRPPSQLPVPLPRHIERRDQQPVPELAHLGHPRLVGPVSGTDDSASRVAAAVEEVRAGRFQWPDRALHSKMWPSISAIANEGEVVDVTPIYRSIWASGEPVMIYEDHPCIAPPFVRAVFGWVNSHDNTMLLVAGAWDRFSDDPVPDLIDDRWETAEPVDWDRVRWVVTANVTVHTSRVSVGPVFGWWIAVYDDGEPADIRWIHYDQRFPKGDFDTTSLVLFACLDFLNASNVETLEPDRPRAERKRIARTGVRVTEIVVRSRSSARTPGASGVSAGTPLTTVRGSWHHYGACCPSHEPKGLLFGKLEGRFWVPGHARGSTDAGTVDHVYRLDPN